MNAQITHDYDECLAEIQAELNRLDADGILLYRADDDEDQPLPAGWVRLSDGTGEAFGPANAILSSLQSVDYDSDATEEIEAEFPLECCDRNCPDWHGDTPSLDSPHAHYHTEYETVQRDNGFELAWEALAEFDDNPPVFGDEEEQS